VLTRLGDISVNTLHYLEQAVVVNETMGLRVYHAQRHCWWAEGLWRAGKLEDARRTIDTAVELAVAMDERGVEAEALMTRAVVARSERAIKRAHDDLTRALSISRALEMRLFEAQALVALGSVLATTPGKQSQASEYRERGLALCQGMGVEPWWPRM